MIKAKEIMTRNPVAVGENVPINDIIKILVENNITGLPVVSDEMYLLGMVTEKDILKALFEPGSKGKIASDLLTADVIQFDEEDDLMDIFRVLVDNSFRRVPIMLDGKLTGVISRRDIIKFLYNSKKKA